MDFRWLEYEEIHLRRLMLLSCQVDQMLCCEMPVKAPCPVFTHGLMNNVALVKERNYAWM